MVPEGRCGAGEGGGGCQSPAWQGGGEAKLAHLYLYLNRHLFCICVYKGGR